MNPNPFSALLHSRKFWLLTLDTVLAITVYFVNKYGSPSFAEDSKVLFGLLQPMFVAVIVGIFVEDNAERGLQKAMYEADKYAEESALYKKSKQESEPEA